MAEKHIHADKIIAWANGAEIQYQSLDGEWNDISEPSWLSYWKYRIKPVETIEYITLNYCYDNEIDESTIFYYGDGEKAITILDRNFNNRDIIGKYVHNESERLVYIYRNGNIYGWGSEVPLALKATIKKITVK